MVNELQGQSMVCDNTSQSYLNSKAPMTILKKKNSSINTLVGQEAYEDIAPLLTLIHSLHTHQFVLPEVATEPGLWDSA